MSVPPVTRLLLVNPHRPVQTAVERLIQRQKLPYVLETTASAQEALARLRQSPCDAVLLDCTNGNGRGWAFLDRAEDSPVILLVDRRSGEAAARAARSGACPCPVDMSDDASDEASLALLPAVVDSAIARKRRIDELHSRLADLAHWQRVATISDTVADLAHELSQPLAAIAAFARACRHRAAGLSGEGRDDVVEFSDQIAGQADRAAHIVGRVRDFVRRADGSRAPADLNVLVQEAAVLLEAEARSRDVRLQLALADELPRATVDRLQIEQVVANLVRNAMEAAETMPEPRRTVTIHTSRGPNDSVEVAVEDQAAGLDPERASRLFEPFYTSKAGGLGLGLWISRSIIEAHGGRIESVPGAEQGTVLRFALPVDA